MPSPEELALREKARRLVAEWRLADPDVWITPVAIVDALYLALKETAEAARTCPCCAETPLRACEACEALVCEGCLDSHVIDDDVEVETCADCGPPRVVSRGRVRR